MEKFLLTVILCIMMACLFIAMMFKNNINRMDNALKLSKTSRKSHRKTRKFRR